MPLLGGTIWFEITCQTCGGEVKWKRLGVDNQHASYVIDWVCLNPKCKKTGETALTETNFIELERMWMKAEGIEPSHDLDDEDLEEPQPPEIIPPKK